MSFRTVVINKHCKLRRQLQWSEETKGKVWTAIVTEKIRQQAVFLHELGHERVAGSADA